MAKINQQTIVITVSELLKDTDQNNLLMTPEMVASIEAVVQQLAEEGAMGKVLVEIQHTEA